MTDQASAFFTLCQEQFQAQVPLSAHTSIRTGGPAQWFLEATSVEQIKQARALAQSQGLPVLVIGRGSNLLVPDAGYPGLVIRIGEGMASVRREGLRLVAQAGISLKSLATYAADNDLAGLAFASGIPGTLGGGALMNAGAFNGDLSQVIESLVCLTREGEEITLSAQDAAFGYRHSRMMQEGLLIVSVTLLLTPGHRDALYATMSEFMALRREKQPLAWPSAGSFFKRPTGYYAGALIEQAGLKGFRVGDAQVSEKHAGFLINLGRATTQDFIDLKNEVQQRVKERFGVLLEPEVRIISPA